MVCLLFVFGCPTRTLHICGIYSLVNGFTRPDRDAFRYARAVHVQDLTFKATSSDV